MRLTLGSVVAIFRDQLQLGRYRHQYDLMDTLLSDYLCEYIDYVLHPTAVSAWLHDRRPLSSDIVGYYRLPGRDRKLAATIAAQILSNFEFSWPRLVSLVMSALVAGLTVGGKAIGKTFAIHSCTTIVHGVGVVISWIRGIPRLFRKDNTK